MYNKSHSEKTIYLISSKLSKVSLGLYSLENIKLKEFKNQVEAGKYLNVYKGTIGRYVKSGKIFDRKYYNALAR